ncbi:MAG: DedA family protein [Nitrospinae bacterium]|nr:DedA family protein [Nitrospinota bacterium]
MDLIKNVLEIFIHLDTHLNFVIQSYGVWTYLILFLIVFCETGLVITPFLPGDSLLFAAGTFAAMGSLDNILLAVILSIAAIAGDTVNYWIGYRVGPAIFHKYDVRFLNREYLDRAHRFYERHGGKTIMIARFMPIIRTFAPFVAGIGRMSYMRFVIYNITGGIFWVAIFIFGGYYFGTIPLVKRNFTIVIMTIIVISIMPGVIEYLRNRYRTS